MRKMPCVFVREFVNNRVANITEQVTPGCEWVLAGEGVPYIKRDGTACAVIGGALHRRYDAKRGKTPPPNAIPCESPDPVTGHWPHWLPVTDEPQDKWFMAAWKSLPTFEPAYEHCPLEDGTYELCGPHFQANPERLACDTFFSHIDEPVLHAWATSPTFESLRKLVSVWDHEGIVFHHEDGRMAKIRRADFGFAWPIPEEP